MLLFMLTGLHCTLDFPTARKTLLDTGASQFQGSGNPETEMPVNWRQIPITLRILDERNGFISQLSTVLRLHLIDLYFQNAI
jgi:hypothetical protein